MQRGSFLKLGQTAAVQLAGADGEGDSRGQQSGSEYMLQSESDSVSNSSSSSLGSEEWGMSDAERSEAVSGGRQRRGPRGGRRQVSRANSAVAPSAAATAAAAASARHIESSSEQSLYAPHSNLLWCDSALQRGALPVSRLLCTDIAGFSSNEAVAPVQVTLLIYTASWDVQQHIRSQLQLEGAAGEQQAQHTAVTDSTPIKQFGPYEATLRKQQSGKKNLRINHLQQQHEQNTYWQYMAGKPHTILLQERVPGPNTPHFKLHLRPGRPSQPRNSYGCAISRAGEAPGLQVAPGSVTEVSMGGAICRTGQHTLHIAKAMACSQLPAGTTFPLAVTLAVVGEGQWQVNLTRQRCGRVHVQLGPNHPMSVFVGRSILRMSLSHDRKLTVTLGPPAPPPPPAAAAASAQRTVASLQPAPLPAAGQGLPAAAVAEAVGDVAVPNIPTAAQAAAGGGQQQPLLPLKRRADRATEPGTGQQQQGFGSMAAAAAATAATTTPVPDTAPGTPMVASSKKSKHAARQAPAVSAAAAAAAAAGPKRTPAVTDHVKQEAAHGPSSQPTAHRVVQAAKQAAAAAAEAAAGVGAGADTPVTAPAAAAHNRARQTAEQPPTPAAVAAAGPPPPTVTPVPIKVQAPEVMDLTADDVGDNGVGVTAAAASASVTDKLPAGLRLESVSSMTAIEDELLKLMTGGLMLLLPAELYAQMMVQLRQLFDSVEGVSVDVVVLQRKYKYVQAAVMGGQVAAVVKELQALIRTCSG